jgi:tetratricopeptide (TPR) repeat protein
MMEIATSLSLLEELRALAAERRYLEIERKLLDLPADDLIDDPEVGLQLVLAWSHLRRTTEALTLTSRLIDQALAVGNNDLALRVELVKSFLLGREGKLHEAERSVKICLERKDSVDCSQFGAAAISSLATILTLRGQWEPAIALFHRALSHYQQLGHSLGVAASHHNLGLANRYCGRLEEAERYFAAASDYYLAEGTVEEHIMAEAERSLAIVGLGDELLAESMIRRSLQACRRIGNRELLAEALRIAGAVLRVCNRPNEARNLLKEGLSLSHRACRKQLQAEIHLELHHLSCKVGRSDAARRHLRRSKRLFEEIGAQGFLRGSGANTPDA